MRHTSPNRNVPGANAPAELQLQLHNKGDIAEATRVSKRTVDQWVRERKIPSILLSPRCRRFNLNAVMQALSKFEQKEVG